MKSKKIVLEYGQKVIISANPISWVLPGLSIGITSGNPEQAEFTIEKYWSDDTDPMAYKVKLVPSDATRFGSEKFYSSDLVSMIEQGQATLVNELVLE